MTGSRAFSSSSRPCSFMQPVLTDYAIPQHRHKVECITYPVAKLTLTTTQHSTEQYSTVEWLYSERHIGHVSTQPAADPTSLQPCANPPDHSLSEHTLAAACSVPGRRHAPCPRLSLLQTLCCCRAPTPHRPLLPPGQSSLAAPAAVWHPTPAHRPAPHTGRAVTAVHILPTWGWGMAHRGSNQLSSMR